MQLPPRMLYHFVFMHGSKMLNGGKISMKSSLYQLFGYHIVFNSDLLQNNSGLREIEVLKNLNV